MHLLYLRSLLNLVAHYFTSLALLSFPMPVKVIRRFKKNDTPPTMMPAMAAAGKTNTFSVLLYALGIYISALFAGI